MLKITTKTFTSIFFILVFLLPVSAQQWVTVKSDSRFNFSGMALVEQTENKKTFIVVHDNKDQFTDAKANPLRDKTERAGLLIIENGAMRPTYQNLKWIDANGTENALPVDLEAITAIPGEPNRFLAGVGNPFEPDLKARVYYIELSPDRESVRVLNSFKRPTKLDGRDFEGLAVQKIGGVLMAFWADRGFNQKPGTIFWGEIDLKKGEIKQRGEAAITTPAPFLADFIRFPAATTRSISDLKIDVSGGVFVTSVLDALDEGPFASDFYYVGSFSKQSGGVSFVPSTAPIKLYDFKNYKIEAFEFVPGKTGGVIFGTDDELFGASVFVNW